MKRILISFLFFLIIPIVLFADVNIDLAPYYAFAGIPVGSDAYKGGDGWTENNNKYDVTTWKPKGTYKDKITDAEMIGLFKVTGLASNITSPITVTVSTPNGLYMESQSEPAYRRPIEIWLFPKYDGSNQSAVQLSEDNKSQAFFSDASSTKKYPYNNVWFDVALVLPGKLNTSTNEIEVTAKDGTVTYYRLVDATDYSCLATFTVTYGTKSETITIPFTGYYDSTKNTDGNGQYKMECDVSMNIVMNSNAYNINMKDDQGKWIDIGEISVLAGAEYQPINGAVVLNPQYPVVFFSSSPNPLTQGDEFVMTLDSLKATDALTSQNSLGFDLRVGVPELTSTVDEAAYSQTGYLTFDGTAFMNSTLLGYTDTSTYKQKFADAGFIIPHKYTASTSHGGTHKDTVYYAYSSRLEMQLDTSDVTMVAGRYTGDIYVHVLLLN